MNSINTRKTLTIFLAFCLFLLIPFCSKKEKQDEMDTVVNNSSLSDEEALYKISKILFGDSLKSFKSEKNSSGKQEVTIEYGGNRAYTFYSEGNYSERIQFETVRYILLYCNPAQKRNLETLRVSLVKPYFVKEPEVKKELTEEFEVFRVSVSLSDLAKVSGWENPKLTSDKRNINNSQVVELFNQVRLQWKIELNELQRIELK